MSGSAAGQKRGREELDDSTDELALLAEVADQVSFVQPTAAEVHTVSLEKLAGTFAAEGRAPRFPTKNELDELGIMDPPERAAVRRMIAFLISKRAGDFFNQVIAAAPECQTLLTTQDALILANIYAVAEHTNAASGGRRRKHMRGGGPLAESLKGLFNAVCSLQLRLKVKNDADALAAIEGLKDALDSTDPAKIQDVMRYSLIAGMGWIAKNDLQSGAQGYIGSLVSVIATVLAKSVPNYREAIALTTGVASIAATAAAAIAPAIPDVVAAALLGASVVYLRQKGGKIAEIANAAKNKAIEGFTAENIVVATRDTLAYLAQGTLYADASAAVKKVIDGMTASPALKLGTLSLDSIAPLSIEDKESIMSVARLQARKTKFLGIADAPAAVGGRRRKTKKVSRKKRKHTTRRRKY